MKKIVLGLMLMLMVALTGSALYAQDIAGDWQGTLHVGPGLRLLLQVSKGDAKAGQGEWAAKLVSVDQGSTTMPVDSISLQNSTVKFAVSAIHGSYEGKLSSDGNSITGTWTQGPPMPLTFERASKESSWLNDKSPHKVSLIPVDKDVNLEVLDWGGTGRPLVLLTGLGDTAHTFDTFAPKLTDKYHVYGITRRGFGNSSAPVPANDNYSADRLGDDVLAVIAALKLDKPVIAGHSIAGEELSSIGSRHPEKVAGLIYLDAGYAYAFYNEKRGDMMVDMIDLRNKLSAFLAGNIEDPKQGSLDIQANLAQLGKDLQGFDKKMASMPSPPKGSHPPPPPPIIGAIMGGQQKYTQIKCPVLAIYADPHDYGPMFMKDDPAARKKALDDDKDRTTAQANAFQAGIPSAHVVLLPNASHMIYKSNEADVLREMNAFIAGLPAAKP